MRTSTGRSLPVTSTAISGVVEKGGVPADFGLGTDGGDGDCGGGDFGESVAFCVRCRSGGDFLCPFPRSG